MPVTDLDIWGAANLLIKRHSGPDAAIVAAQRSERLAIGGFCALHIKAAPPAVTAAG